MWSTNFHILYVSFFAAAFAHPSCPLPGSPTFSSSRTCSFPPHPYIVAPSFGKNLGMFTRHTLEPGSIIMRETPVLVIGPSRFPRAAYPMAEVKELVRAEYDKLSQSGKDQVASLTFHVQEWEEKPQTLTDKLGYIFRTNAYETDSSVGLFPRIARINHSCRPNAAYYWSTELNKRIVYATRTIAEGEEIFVSYIPLLLTREERQQRLNRYGFTCTCSACSQSTHNLSTSDQRRKEIKHAFLAFEPQLKLDIPQTTSSFRKATKNAASSLELKDLVEKEELADYYAKVYRIVAISHARIRDWEKASVWANMGYERKVMEDSKSIWTLEMYELTRRFIENWEGDLKNRTG
ncbi:hypothetical protein B0J11DRAFT_208876 [Dendryphion nanum]|uniref:SET domain-containing protein n=1 Tax=Dendryphion nanum TaxID=256645 RepID=A0A9P9IUR9_9PLEO|nr:hypothetical protein B0J11DRAFT_208876 [Dendryphion nanum]